MISEVAASHEKPEPEVGTENINLAPTGAQEATIFSCEEAALEVQMSLFMSVCLSVYQVRLNPVNREMYRGQTLQVRVM